MVSRAPRWPWYYHVSLILFCISIDVAYRRLRPTPRQADVAFIVVLALLAVVLTALQVQKRKNASQRRDGVEPPRGEDGRG